MINFNFIETKRFILKKITLEDCGDRYFSWLQSRESSKFIKTAKQVSNINELSDYVSSKIAKNNVLFLAIYEKKNMIHI